MGRGPATVGEIEVDETFLALHPPCDSCGGDFLY